MSFFKNLLRAWMGGGSYGHHGKRRYGHHGNYGGDGYGSPRVQACAQCGAGNTAEARFCAQCGASLQGARCSACGAEVALGAKFCPAFGQAVRKTSL